MNRLGVSMDWVTYKYNWWPSTYQVSLPFGQGKALCDELARHPEIEFVWLCDKPKWPL